MLGGSTNTEESASLPDEIPHSPSRNEIKRDLKTMVALDSKRLISETTFCKLLILRARTVCAGSAAAGNRFLVYKFLGWSDQAALLVVSSPSNFEAALLQTPRKCLCGY